MHCGCALSSTPALQHSRDERRATSDEGGLERRFGEVASPVVGQSEVMGRGAAGVASGEGGKHRKERRDETSKAAGERTRWETITKGPI